MLEDSKIQVQRLSAREILRDVKTLRAEAKKVEEQYDIALSAFGSLI